MNFSNLDIEQIENIGLSLADVNKQLEHYEFPQAYVNLKAFATIDYGIVKLSESELNSLVQYYEEQKDALSVVKFTPASGAASRMFKMLHEFLAEYDPQKQSINSYINKNKITELFLFFVTI